LERQVDWYSSIKTVTKNTDIMTIKPIAEYLMNGPIPADDLAYLDFIGTYLDCGIAGTILDVHFILEYTCDHGAPRWWKGTVTEFEESFHNNYHLLEDKMDSDSDFIRQAAELEVREQRSAPLPYDATKEQQINFLAH